MLLSPAETRKRKNLIRKLIALKRHGGVLSKAAEHVGLKKTTVFNTIRMGTGLSVDNLQKLYDEGVILRDLQKKRREVKRKARLPKPASVPWPVPIEEEDDNLEIMKEILNSDLKHSTKKYLIYFITK